MSGKKAVIGMGESQSGRYLVIEARWDNAFFQRFGFVLRDEESLRQRMAGASVVGIGFGHCKATVAEKLAVHCEADQHGVQSPRPGLRHRLELSETRRIASSALQYAIAACVLIFYSESVLGAALRALVGG